MMMRSVPISGGPDALPRQADYSLTKECEFLEQKTEFRYASSEP